MSKHTPGPWSIDETEDTLFIRADGKLEAIVAQVELNSEIITTVDEVEPGEQRRNAHLIAAAPDAVPLFEDLQEYLCEHGGLAVELLQRIDAWLAKAEGH